MAFFIQSSFTLMHPGHLYQVGYAFNRNVNTKKIMYSMKNKYINVNWTMKQVKIIHQLYRYIYTHITRRNVNWTMK